VLVYSFLAGLVNCTCVSELVHSCGWASVLLWQADVTILLYKCNSSGVQVYWCNYAGVQVC
jgi:hypothetical protein